MLTIAVRAAVPYRAARRLGREQRVGSPDRSRIRGSPGGLLVKRTNCKAWYRQILILPPPPP